MTDMYSTSLVIQLMILLVLVSLLPINSGNSDSGCISEHSLTARIGTKVATESEAHGWNCSLSGWWCSFIWWSPCDMERPRHRNVVVQQPQWSVYPNGFLVDEIDSVLTWSASYAILCTGIEVTIIENATVSWFSFDGVSYPTQQHLGQSYFLIFFYFYFLWDHIMRWPVTFSGDHNNINFVIHKQDVWV